MRLSLFTLIFILLFFISGCKKDETGDPNYPTVILIASSEKINQILALLSESPLTECTSVDEFGYCVADLKNDECGPHFDSVYVNYSKEEIIDSFYRAVSEYRNLLNITDTTGIRVNSIKNLKGVDYDKYHKTYADSVVSQGWIVTSNNQEISGYEIPGTAISMLISFNRVRSIGGKRYKLLYIPVADVFSEESAKESLLNVELLYKNSKIKPSVNTYWYKSEKIIFPIIKSDRIELRVCWALFPEKWQVIVDTQTGEVLNSFVF